MKEDTLNPEAMLCFDVYTLQQAFGRLYKPLLDPLGLTYPQYLVMVVLWEGDALPVTAIGGRIGLDSSTLTPLVKRLEQAGLVTRTRDSEDERRVIVKLTEAGRALRLKASDIPACVEAATGLDRRAIADLRAQLARLRHAITSA
ncbi:MarR family transcriptional regulator [Sulfitobacter sp. HNIBRBA3233]|uniref:MarR family winged helix-turn-helix transcriptional regulator n=1 Tax=Sulfitobacter marinivivus TaxID=3158558 RepID=UPI0032E009A7